VLRGTEIHLLPSGTVVVRIPGAWEVATGVPVPAPAERHAPVPDPVAPPAETAEPETPPLTEESLPPLPESLLGIEG